jgi:TfoX/Sxy family transcriptional regulator of competence genes
LCSEHGIIRNMSTQQSTVDYILDQLSGLDVSARKMFGEYALYCDGKTTAFICDDTLLVKILPENKHLATDLPLGKPYPAAKDYYEVPGDRLEDIDWLSEFIQVTAAAVPVKKK